MIVLGLLVACLAIAKGASFSGRVIGGSTAPDYKYPYVVSLRARTPETNDSHVCGGVILNEYWILTSGYCVKYSGKLMKIVAGTNNLNQTGESYKILFTVVHSNYETYRHDNIGLVRINGRIKFSERVQPIVLPSEDFEGSGITAQFAGWGSMDVDGPSSDALQEISLQIISNDLCKQTEKEITEKHMCTLNGENEGICYDDLGGPLVVDGVLVGIASHLALPCALGYPDIFTRVSSYVKWIKEVQAKWANVVPQ